MYSIDSNKMYSATPLWKGTFFWSGIKVSFFLVAQLAPCTGGWHPWYISRSSSAGVNRIHLTQNYSNKPADCAPDRFHLSDKVIISCLFGSVAYSANIIFVILNEPAIKLYILLEILFQPKLGLNWWWKLCSFRNITNNVLAAIVWCRCLSYCFWYRTRQGLEICFQVFLSAQKMGPKQHWVTPDFSKLCIMSYAVWFGT